MEFVNKTPLPAKLFIGKVEGATRRIGLVVAKATFHVGPDGVSKYDMDDPYPIFPSDEETLLGLLPRDDLPKTDGIDVIVLGNAYAPKDQLISHMTVSLMIGRLTRYLLIFGDREWVKRKKISSPKLFDIMPLIYGRAFGGSAEVEIDRGSFITVSDPRNPDGKGFDAIFYSKSLAKMLKPLRGYPRMPEVRVLPNIEDPDHLIRSWEDSPAPASWATLPMTSALHAQRSIYTDNNQFEMLPSLFHRAHPSLVLTDIAPLTEVQLRGMTPNGQMYFRVPDWQVRTEFLLNKRHVEERLKLDTLVILPERKRFYVVYRLLFNYEFESHVPRSARLKVLMSPENPQKTGGR